MDDVINTKSTVKRKKKELEATMQITIQYVMLANIILLFLVHFVLVWIEKEINKQEKQYPDSEWKEILKYI